MANERPDTTRSPGVSNGLVAVMRPIASTVIVALTFSLVTGIEAAGFSDLPESIEITAAPLMPPSPAGEKPFTRIEAREIGIYRPLEFS